MRIAILVDTFPSVSETFIANKVDQLSSRGHELYIFCNKKNKKLFEDLFPGKSKIQVIVLKKVNVFIYSFLHIPTILQCVFRRKHVLKHIYANFRVHTINARKPDIIHFEFSGIGVNYLPEIKKLNAVKVLSCRGSGEKVKLLVYEDRKQKFSNLLQLVDAIHCVSNDIKQTIIPYCNNPEKIFINYPSIDTAYFKRRTEKTKGPEKIILSVGRFTFQKGYSTGLLAMHILKLSGIPFRWVIVGSGQDYEAIVFQIHELQLNDYVELAGAKSRSEVKTLMEEADIFFLPSVYEGIANVALEAMSMELPVVATRSGGMEEVITNGKEGFLSDIYDHVSLSNNLLTLIKDPELCGKMGALGRKRIEDGFNLSLQTDKFESVYLTLTEHKKTEHNKKPATETIIEKNIPTRTIEHSAKKLRIAVIVPQFPTYTETFFINKVIGLCSRGHRVTVFCNSFNSDTLLYKSYGLDKFRNLHIVPLDFNQSVWKIFATAAKNPIFLVKSIFILAKKSRRILYLEICKHYFKKYPCDIYHFGYSGLAVAYSSLLNTLPGKTVISCRGTAENVKPITEKGRADKLYLVLNKADKIHCVSRKMADTIIGYGAPAEKIFVNHSAVDITIFSRRNAYSEKQFIHILSVGRLVFQKGFIIGIMAIIELKKRFQQFRWTIVGDGPEWEKLAFYVSSLGLGNHIKLEGKKTRNEIIQFYEACDIFFSPSVCEGIANVVLEAMAMEIPVVSSINGGIEEAITNGVNGILCNNYDFVAMAGALRMLCNSFEERVRLGKNGRKIIETDFSIQKNIDTYEQVYYELKG